MKKSTTPITSDRQSGFTLIEVMIAICIVGIGLMAVAKFQVTALHADKLAREQTEAAMWASNQAEALLNTPIGNAALDPSANPHSISPVGENGKYNVSWTVEQANGDPNVLVILITVRWNNANQNKKLDFAYLKTAMM